MIPVLAVTVFAMLSPAHQDLDCVESPALAQEDKESWKLARRLLREIGDDVWPGFREASLPLVLYDDRFEYALGLVEARSPWERVEADDFEGERYFRRAARDPQAFAVKIDDVWAGRLNTLSNMNDSMRVQLAERMPERFVELAMKNMGLRPAQHTAALLHETFHAYQATQAPDRFQAAVDCYVDQRLYPDDEAFAQAWNDEGAALIRAAAARERDEAIRRIREFLAVRDARRQSARLDPALVAFERHLEWLEGLAKYVEDRLLEEAVAAAIDPAEEFQVAWQRRGADVMVRSRRLGKLEGDTRFYLSGAAQARLLERWSPDWKDRALDHSPEELLRHLVEE